MPKGENSGGRNATAITPELTKRVIDLYNKGTSLNIMPNLGVCSYKVARKIVEDAGIRRPSFNFNHSKIDFSGKKRFN